MPAFPPSARLAFTHPNPSLGEEGWKAGFLALKHVSRILGHSSNPVSGFSMIEQVRPCAVRPMENSLGSCLNEIQDWTTV